MPWDTILVLAIVTVVTLVVTRDIRKPRSSVTTVLHYGRMDEDKELFEQCGCCHGRTHPPVVSFEKYDQNLRSGVLDLACDDCGTAIVEGQETISNSEGCLAHRDCPDVYMVIDGDGRVLQRLTYSPEPPPDTSWITTEIVRW